MSLLQDKIKKWKEIYKDIYQLTVGDREGEFSITFIYRNIGRKDYNDLIIAHKEQATLEEEICRQCTLYPKYDFSEGKGGVAEVLANAIVSTSYLIKGQAENLLSEYREEMNYFDFQVECIIHEAFPGISLEEISNWTVQKTMYYFSRAEWILKNIKGIPIEYYKDEENQQPTYQHSFTSDRQNNSNSSSPNKELSEAEVMQMIAEKEAEQGRTINPNLNSVGEIYPELSWFKAEEELKGEFD